MGASVSLYGGCECRCAPLWAEEKTHKGGDDAPRGELGHAQHGHTWQRACERHLLGDGSVLHDASHVGACATAVGVSGCDVLSTVGRGAG